MIIFRSLFQGRLNRDSWLIGWLLVIINYLTGWFFLTVFLKVESDLYKPLNIIVFTILCLTLIFFISINVRRKHDVGKSGWEGVWGMEGGWTEYFEKGQQKPNKYGNPPKPGVDIKKLFGLS